MDAQNFFLKNGCMVGTKVISVTEQYANLKAIEVLEGLQKYIPFENRMFKILEDKISELKQSIKP